MYSPVITGFWQQPFTTGEVIHGNGGLSITINPSLPHDRRVTVLTEPHGPVRAALTPALAERINLRERDDWTDATFRAALDDAGITLYDADLVHYYTESAKRELLAEPDATGVRLFDAQDARAFAVFESANTEADRDDAYVELDHWAVYGAEIGSRLVSAASAYPWADSALADLGVLSLPEARGKGHGRNVVRALARHVSSRGHEPQYRCQEGNVASRALAEKAGLSLFGTWQVISPDSAH